MSSQMHVYFIKYLIPGTDRWATLRRDDGSCSFLTSEAARGYLVGRFDGQALPAHTIEPFPPYGEDE